MNITDFKIKAHKICDRWYFKQTEDALEMWEKPYLKGPGYEKHYIVLTIPLEILCLGETRDEYLTQKLQGLKWNHEQRMLGRQVENTKAMFARNDQRKEIKKKAFSSETKAFFKESRSIFKKIADEEHGTNTRSHLIADCGKGEVWEDAKRTFHKQLEQRQGVGA